MSETIVDPHDKMRGRDLNKVARGEQAPRPPQQHPNVSNAPPPSSTYSKPPTKVEGSKANQDDEWLNEANTSTGDLRFSSADKPHYCYTRYLEYYICTQGKVNETVECEKFAKYYRSFCPIKLIEKWDGQRKHGTFPSPI